MERTFAKIKIEASHQWTKTVSGEGTHKDCDKPRSTHTRHSMHLKHMPSERSFSNMSFVRGVLTKRGSRPSRSTRRRTSWSWLSEGCSTDATESLLSNGSLWLEVRPHWGVLAEVLASVSGFRLLRLSITYNSHLDSGLWWFCQSRHNTSLWYQSLTNAGSPQRVRRLCVLGQLIE